jgi:hypothetical protein
LSVKLNLLSTSTVFTILSFKRENKLILNVEYFLQIVKKIYIIIKGMSIKKINELGNLKKIGFYRKGKEKT